jgi:FkbM family methyltransferase
MKIEDFIRHNDAAVSAPDQESGNLKIGTPKEQWAYAVEYIINSIDHGTHLAVELNVVKGVVGVCLLDENGSIVASDAAGRGRHAIKLPIEGNSVASLVFRNNSGSGSSTFTLTSLGFSDIEGMGETYDTTHEYESVDERPLRVDPRIFQRFELHSGLTPAGFWSDWLGGRTRSDVWNFPEEIREIYGTDRVETIPYNSFGEHVLDWAPLVLAMQWAGPLATTIALGAGWGRWAVGAAIAARKLEKDYHITAVEAEPQHFAWLERHIRDNDIDPQKARLLHAAAGAQSGYCWFQTGDPAGWYGQQIVESVAPPKEDDPEFFFRDGIELRKTPVVSLEEVSKGLMRVDYLHMDIQGAEADVIEAGRSLIDARFKVVNIGTHSDAIEARLRSVFVELGWMNLFDVSLGGVRSLEFGERTEKVTFGDGVQVWVNPWI